MITPDLPLAKAISAAVLDQIEQDRSINRENITVAVLGRMMLMEAMSAPATRQGGEDEVLMAARRLRDALPSDPACAAPSQATMDAWSALDLALRRRGA